MLRLCIFPHYVHHLLTVCAQPASKMESLSSNTCSALCSALIIAAISINQAVADFCHGYNDHYTGDYITGFNCPGLNYDYSEYKCCGPSDGQYCCNLEDYNNYYGHFYWSVGKIIGVVIGALLGLVLLVVIIAIVICCYVKNLRRQKQHQQTTTISSTQPMTRTTTTQRSDYPQQRQGYPQQERQAYTNQEPVYQHIAQEYPLTNYAQSQGYSHPKLTYPGGQSYAQQAQPPPISYTQTYHQQELEYSSPPPTYYSHQPEAATTFAPEVAPPPPID